MIKLSAVIITLNEEKNIGRCIDSLNQVADEILVVDSFSTDRTKEICLQKGATVIDHPFKDYVDQRRFTFEKARYDHILTIDADEEISEKLKLEILKVKNNWQADGYQFNRLNNYCGTWIHHGGWYPDKKLRLVNRTCGLWEGQNVHEHFAMKEDAILKHIKGDLLHYSYSTIAEHIHQANKYSGLGATHAFNKGKTSNIFKVLLFPFWRFLRNYIIKRGFLDGYNGFVIAIINAHENFLKYTKMLELQRNQKKPIQ